MAVYTFQIQVRTGQRIPRLRMVKILHIGVVSQRMHRSENERQKQQKYYCLVLAVCRLSQLAP
jgi:hypothetical protein